MARIPRTLTVYPNYSVHKVWRGHNKEWNLETEQQKLAYLNFLNQDLESKRYRAGSEIQALTLMSNHSHEVSGVTDPKLYSDHMRRHHSRYGSFFNRLKKRSGKVAEDRPHTTLLENEEREMETVFYIHANPVRANIVKEAHNYHWSTHRLYAFGERAKWMRNVRLPPWYLKLAATAELRQRAYRRLFALYLREKGITKQSFLKKCFFGSLLWREDLESKIKIWREVHKPPK